MFKQFILPLLTLSLSAAQPTTWNFEQEAPTLEQGWVAISDREQLLGSSFVSVAAEADGGNNALRIIGSVQSNTRDPFRQIDPFAGAMHYFSATPFRAADLSQAKTLSFRAKGNGAVEVALFQNATGVRPYSKTVQVGSEWKEYTFELASFGVDTAQLTAVAFGRNTPGSLDAMVDDIRIQ
ncbi:hypothetical protein [Holophaga foetida]|uniref:hypothetical protein n=1 Tax=Holophaga foetida TaxID=35839 RepID=UPI000247177C|nr:hypothetical protein [Holophaga foetida]